MNLAAANAPQGQEPCLALFVLRTDRTAQIPLRVLGLLAQHDRVADEASIKVDANELLMELVLSGWAPEKARRMAERIRSLIGIRPWY